MYICSLFYILSLSFARVMGRQPGTAPGRQLCRTGIRSLAVPLLISSAIAMPGMPVSANDYIAMDLSPETAAEQQRLQGIQDTRKSPEVSANVPSRKTVVSLDPKDSIIETNDFIGMKTLKSIPSYKYFRAISKEYSSRSTDYREGKENLFAPFQ